MWCIAKRRYLQVKNLILNYNIYMNLKKDFLILSIILFIMYPYIRQFSDGLICRK